MIILENFLFYFFTFSSIIPENCKIILENTGISKRLCHDPFILFNPFTSIYLVARNIVPDAIIIDGCAMLHSAIQWPKGGTVNNLLAGVRSYIKKKLTRSDVYLLYDRYKEFSIKSDTRQERSDQFRCSHTLKNSSPLPSKEITLRDTKTKVQIIEMVEANLMKNLPAVSNKFIITSKENIPEQLHFGRRSERHDLMTTQEEAIIHHQVLAAIRNHQSKFVVTTHTFMFFCATLTTLSCSP